jgi:hypothetical protein
VNKLTKEELAYVIYCLEGSASVAGIQKPWILDLIAKVQTIESGVN